MRRIAVPLVPRWLRYLGVAAVASFLFYFSVLSPPPVEPPSPGPFWDKKLHFAAYAGLAFALAYATAHLRDHPYRRIALVILLAVGYGLFIEGIQGLLADRYLSLADALANVIGALLASAWFLVERRLRYVRPLEDDESRRGSE